MFWSLRDIPKNSVEGLKPPHTPMGVYPPMSTNWYSFSLSFLHCYTANRNRANYSVFMSSKCQWWVLFLIVLCSYKSFFNYCLSTLFECVQKDYGIYFVSLYIYTICLFSLDMLRRELVNFCEIPPNENASSNLRDTELKSRNNQLISILLVCTFDKNG